MTPESFFNRFSLTEKLPTLAIEKLPNYFTSKDSM